MRSDCDICGGLGRVRLPVRPRLEAIADGVGLPAEPRLKEASREYPCLECAPVLSEDRVAFAEAETQISGMIYHSSDADGYRQAAHRNIAMSLADHFLRHGYIDFSEDRPDKIYDVGMITGRLGVVAPMIVASMEKRIAERQTQKAEEVVSAAIARVQHWGSAYSGPEGNIPKGRAVDILRQALKDL